MGVKKEFFEKILLGVLTFILIVYTVFLLSFLSIFSISKKFLNKDNVREFISTIDISSIIKSELSSEIGEFELIKEELTEIGVTDNGIKEFVNSYDVKQFSSNIIINILNKTFNKRNIEYKITEDDISELFENNIDKLEITTSTESEKLIKKIESKIPNLTISINHMLDKLCEKLENSPMYQKYQGYIYSAINILDIIYSDFAVATIVFVITSLLVLLVYIGRDIYKSLKWFSVVFLIPAIIFGRMSTIILSFVHSNNILLNNILIVVNIDIIKHSTIYFTISIIFVIINILICFIRRYKKKVSNEE